MKTYKYIVTWDGDWDSTNATKEFDTLKEATFAYECLQNLLDETDLRTLQMERCEIAPGWEVQDIDDNYVLRRCATKEKAEQEERDMAKYRGNHQKIVEGYYYKGKYHSWED